MPDAGLDFTAEIAIVMLPIFTDQRMDMSTFTDRLLNMLTFTDQHMDGSTFTDLVTNIWKCQFSQINLWVCQLLLTNTLDSNCLFRVFNKSSDWEMYEMFWNLST